MIFIILNFKSTMKNCESTQASIVLTSPANTSSFNEQYVRDHEVKKCGTSEEETENFCGLHE